MEYCTVDSIANVKVSLLVRSTSAFVETVLYLVLYACALGLILDIILAILPIAKNLEIQYSTVLYCNCI